MRRVAERREPRSRAYLARGCVGVDSFSTPVAWEDEDWVHATEVGRKDVRRLLHVRGGAPQPAMSDFSEDLHESCTRPMPGCGTRPTRTSRGGLTATPTHGGPYEKRR